MTQIDYSILTTIYSFTKNIVFDKIMPIITLFAEHSLGWIIFALVLLFFKKTRTAGLCMLFALLLGFLTTDLLLKNLICRPRPFESFPLEVTLIPLPKGYSFPSGHTTSSFCAATALFCQHKKAGIFALIFAFMVAFSRLYLLVHFPSDVLAGIIIGITLGVLSSKINDMVEKTE